MISAVIRTHNEAHWIGRCLEAMTLQRAPVDDIVIVDNDSTDATLEIARSFDVKVVTISRENFSYGRALNLGIEACKNEVVSMISAHCVPVDELWSAYLWAHFQDDADGRLCGVYGRQEPLPETSAMDARDLWTTFREERQTQSHDYFFHNANSAIRKSLWDIRPFDEEIRGVEDRAWAKLMLADGYQVRYEPHARVYHAHGIHQGRNEGRARRVVAAIRHIRDNL
ncbi:glycosyltransferase [Magnetofaba australis]|uniref:Putative glycoside hydrolase family 2 protein n=1 Tax=Magnetofaba australis IT-1 TaxID=1434232 RepID=A0A1Y2JYY1_9PROT|nr:glycosyltransferase family A protein [Magnetofaba australis]OSM00108.1 putative glycoside hydrolase family 2 protein [Magnetofaba australis IT-1]